MPQIDPIKSKAPLAWNAKQLAGLMFGRLDVLSFAGRDSNGKLLWKCRCVNDGNVTIVTSDHLLSGHTQSCGCFGLEERIDSVTRHGSRYTPEYRAWLNMNSRCHCKSSSNYGNYGGRGIAVCERWRTSFEDFLKDVGQKPSPGHSLDRFPDTNGNYEPGNVRWATDRDQRRNKRNSKIISYNGRTMCASDWGRVLGIDPCKIRYRLSRGMSGHAIIAMFSSGGAA